MAIDKSILRRVRRTVNKIENAIYPTMQQVFNKYDNVIKEYNTQQQLFDKGQDSKGLRLKPYARGATSQKPYASSTISIKIRKGQPTDRITLKDTGAFYNDVNVIAEPDKLIIEASIEYAKYLVARYGEDILGVQNQNLQDFYDKYIEQQLDKNINKIISANKL
jgi:hypothetical protein